MVAVTSERVPDNAEQLRRRANRRLLGASVLLLIAIIAVPMFLEREPPALPDNVDVRIPPVEGTKFEPKFPDGKKAAANVDRPAEIPAITEPTGSLAGVSPVQSSPAPAVVPPLAEVAKAPTVAAAAPVAPLGPGVPAAPKADASKAPEKAAEKAPPKPAVEAERKPGQLVIQVIAVRDAAVAKQMYERAKSLKFPAYTEQIDVANNAKVTRVRIGPYNTKQQAEAARAKLARAGFEAKVLTLQ
jgi:DedD protein